MTDKDLAHEARKSYDIIINNVTELNKRGYECILTTLLNNSYKQNILNDRAILKITKSITRQI